MRKPGRNICIVCILLSILLPVAAAAAGGIYYDLGVFSYEEGNYEEAERNLQQALAADSADPLANQYLGRTYTKMERFPEAMRCLLKARESGVEPAGLDYDIAYLNYRMEKYAEAARLFTDIAAREPDNILARYYAGICLFREQQYGASLDYLVGAADRSPTLRDNGYYYAGISYFKMGDMERAVEKFEYVKESASDAALRDYASQWLDAVRAEKERRKPYELYAKFGYQYDNNVTLDPVDKDIYADEEDTAFVLYASGKYDVLEREHYTAGAGYTHYQTWHSDLSEYDLTGSIFQLYGNYRLKSLTFGLSYLPHYYWLDGESFLMRHQVRPEVLWRLSDRVVARFSYSYYHNKHFEDEDRDSDMNEIALDGYYSLPDKRGFVFGGIGCEKNSAAHQDFDYTQMKLRLGVFLRMPYEFELYVTGKYYGQTYDNRDSLYNIDREDDKYYASLSLERKIVYEWLHMLAEYNFTKNDSNIDDYTYKRQVTSLSLVARF